MMAQKTNYLPGYRPLMMMFLMTMVALVAVTIGKNRANAESERLQVVWPNLINLHEKQKLVLLQASARCRLTSLPLPVSASEVVGCLERGVDRENRETLAAMIKRSPSSK